MIAFVIEFSPTVKVLKPSAKMIFAAVHTTDGDQTALLIAQDHSTRLRSDILPTNEPIVTRMQPELASLPNTWCGFLVLNSTTSPRH